MERYPSHEDNWLQSVREIGSRALSNFGKTLHYVFDHIQHETPSEHFRGAAAQLDRELYDQLELPIIERPDAGQLSKSVNRWDSLGDYHREV